MPELGFHLGAHHVQPFDGVQVVEVGDLLALAVLRENRGDPLTAYRQGSGLRLADARVAIGQVVVIGADQDLDALVSLGQRLSRGHQVASIERHSHRPPAGLKQTGSGGVPLSHQQDAGGLRADVEKMACLGQACGPEIFVASLTLFCMDELQTVDPGRGVQHRDDDRALGRKAHAVALHSLAVQVGGVAVFAAQLPHLLRAHGGTAGLASAPSLSGLHVRSNARLQRGALIGAQGRSLELDLLRVGLSAAPDPI